MDSTSESRVPRPDEPGEAADNMFELVTRALNVAYYEWVPGRDALRFSPALFELFGYEPGAWTPQRSLESIHQDDRAAHRAARIAYLKSGADRAEFTYRARMANGDWRWLRDQTTVERDGSGRVTRLVGAVSDITEAKRREAQNRELIARQAASIEVLRTISASPDNPQPVFELIARRACELCRAARASVTEYDGALLHMRAHDGYDPAGARLADQVWPQAPTPGTVHGRVVLSGGIVQIRDLESDPEYGERSHGHMQMLGSRSLLGVPLLRDGRVVGSITLGRGETGGFSDDEVALVQSFAEQAVIAIASAEALRKLQERTAALARRNSEYGERIEQQSATIDVLKVMSASPGDAQPVFELITRRALEFCGASGARLVEVERGLRHLRALVRVDGETEADAALRRLYPATLDQDSIDGRVILSRRIVHTRNASETPPGMRGRYSASVLGMPLLRDGHAAGAIVLSRAQPGGFSEAQIELLQTFAEQAVIAIGSAETYRALQDRTAALALRNSEYSERIEQQAATIDVLKVMSASPGDAQPVFQLIVDRARAFCGADQATLALLDGDMLHLRAHRMPAEFAASYEAQFPRPINSATMFGRAILTRDAVQIEDVVSDPEHISRTRAGGPRFRAIIALPLLRAGEPIGAIALGRREPGVFSPTQTELLRTFAEQAVIAVGSAETYRALQERTAALAKRNSEYGEQIAQQSATIDVLKAMSASPGDAQPVFELIVERARAFCGAEQAAVALATDGSIRLRAHSGTTVAHQSYAASFPRPISADTLFGRTILARDVVQIPDNAADPGFALAKDAQAYGIRAHAGVPMLRGIAVIGALVIARATPGDFSATQIDLLRTFAEQAVIAVGSADTYRALQERTAALALRNSEYGERIEHQSATIDVLKVMSASPGETQPVFDLIVRRAQELCNGMSVGLFEYDGELMHIRATAGGDEAANLRYAAMFPMAPSRQSLAGRAILDRQIVHVRDMDTEPGLFQAVRDLGARTTITLPLLRDGAPIGAISLNSPQPGGFSDSQIELLNTFAEQAVIAIGSTQTYRELRARTAALAQRNSEFGERIQQQSATIDVLRAMSASPDDTQPVFDLISRQAKELCNSRVAGIFEYDGQLVHLRSSAGDADSGTFNASYPMVPTRGSIPGRAILDRHLIHVRDMDADPELLPVVRDLLVGELGVKSVLAIPLLRDDTALGAFVINASDVGGFTESQVGLLRAFAEQAVIAITSADNFRALRDRTAELTRSVAELQTLEEVLRAVNSSLDLDTVLATIISRAVQLSQADEGTIYEFDTAEQVFVPKATFGMSTERVEWLRDRKVRLGETHLGRAAVLRAPVHIEDVQQEPELADAGVVLRGIHAVLAVPLLWDDQVAGGLVIRRRTAGGFAPSIPTLLQTFAGQAVLAIENAELFEQARRARTAAETALADLRRAQDRLVQSEKLASLGQLTAGIAHEIKNPLNFVNNFSELSADLLDELHEAIAGQRRAEIDELTATLKGNLEKIDVHGRRADSIVKNMLLHSRTGPSEHRPIDLNATVEEALNLAYHGARAETAGFNVTLEKQLDPRAGMVEMYPQEFTRVMLNLIGNGFYAARMRAAGATSDFEPMLRLTTRDLGEQVEIRVRDNGVGISEAVRGRIFEPFFTTKPAGEGTGLGLSLSYDIIVNQHGGQLTVDSRIDEFTEFTIALPRAMAQQAGQP